MGRLSLFEQAARKRKEAGLSQVAAAKMYKMSLSHLRAIENGARSKEEERSYLQWLQQGRPPLKSGVRNEATPIGKPTDTINRPHLQPIKVREVRVLGLDRLVLSDRRSHRIGNEGVMELANSIQKVGLIEPIIVASSPFHRGKFEVILGERRLLAHRKIDAKAILAVVMSRRMSAAEIVTLQLSRSHAERRISKRNMIDICTLLCEVHGSPARVQQATGISAGDIRKHVKYTRLSAQLKSAVDSGEVDLKMALRLQDMSEEREEIGDQAMAALAMQMKLMSQSSQERLVRECGKKKNKGMAVEEILARAQRTQKVRETVTV